VNKELAALRDTLGVRTTYQAMVWWAQSADRELR
jgi:hypothetical protein